MIRRFREALRPTAADPAIAQQQSLLYIVLLGLAGPGLLFGIAMAILWLLGRTPAAGVIAGLGVQPFYALSYWLGRRGRTRLAALIPVLIVFLVMAASFFQVGVGHVSTVGMAMVVATAGILLGSRIALALSALGVLAYAFAGWAQNTGFISGAILPQEAVIADAIGLGLGLIVLVILNQLFRQEMERALQVERQISEQLQAQQRELEDLVSRRTRGLERRALQLQTAADIAKLASEVPDPEHLIRQAVELIRARFGFYHASIFMMDDTGNWAELAASTGEAGQQMLARKHRLATGSASIIGWVAANRLPRVANDIEADPFHFKNPLLPDTRSELAVPLLVGQRLLGALDVQSTEVEAFTEDDIRTLEAIASELAVAIDSSRVQQEMQAELERMQAAFRAELQDSWRRIVRSGTTSIIHLDMNGERIPPRDSEFTVVDAARFQGSTAVSQNGLEVAVPIQVRGEIIATLAVRRPRGTEPWREEEIALMEAVANQAALSLESARQRVEEQRRLAELEILNRISQAVSQMLPLDTLHRVVHRQIQQVLGPVEMEILLYDGEAQMLRVAFASGSEGQPGSQPRPLGDDLASAVIRSQGPLFWSQETAQQASLFGVQSVDEEARSWMGVPMLLGDEILGVIIVRDFERTGRFSDDDAAMLTTIASQIAAGIQNQRLLEQVQRAARRERLIHEITSKVRRSPDMKTLLETTTRELARALNAARSTITLDLERPGPGKTAWPPQSGSDDGEDREP